MKRMVAVAKISEMESFTESDGIRAWLDDLETRDAKVRVTIEEIEDDGPTSLVIE